jgi:O-succinylbenzoic acid--CoA ligase
LSPGDKWLLALSLHHVAGLGVLFRCASAAGAVFIAAEGESIQEPILLYGLTHVSLVATQLRRLMDSDRGRTALKKLKAILVGGGPIPESLIHESAGLSLRLFTTYGMSEMASQVTTSRPGDNLERLLTSGAPVASNSVRIESDGEICVRSSALFLGYLNGDVLERPLTDDGWFRTGDLGRLDADGYLTVFGRKDNMFVCGGENIHPEEIERHLCRFPGVRATLVLPMSDAEFGAVPVAFVAMNESIKLDIDSLLSAISQNLPRHKIPRRIFPWPKDFEPGCAKINRKDFIAHISDIIVE